MRCDSAEMAGEVGQTAGFARLNTPDLTSLAMAIGGLRSMAG